MIIVKVICYVNVENHFLTFTKQITFTSIMYHVRYALEANHDPLSF